MKKLSWSPLAGLLVMSAVYLVVPPAHSHPRYQSADQQQSDGNAQTAASADTINALRQKAERKQGSTLVFKSLYLGMPLDDLATLFTHYNQASKCDAFRSHLSKMSPGGAIAGLLASDDELNAFKRVEGELPDYGKITVFANTSGSGAIADSTGSVIEIFISADLAHAMFASKNTPRKEFLQTFVDAYSVPALDAEKVVWELSGGGLLSPKNPGPAGVQTVYKHRSDQGWELTFFEDLTIVSQERVHAAGVVGQTLSKAGGGQEGSFHLKKIASSESRQEKFN